MWGSTLLIHYFAEMPEPLLTFGLYERFLDCEVAPIMALYSYDHI